ncbi:MAG TPA: alpha/beta fold hydrolase, partial [Chloroflexota bacterium]|nr:alpha/beta fold hydrolase [Chloroflexota bacterium]
METADKKITEATLETNRECSRDWAMWEETVLLGQRRHDGIRTHTEEWGKAMEQHGLRHLAHLALISGEFKESQALRERALAFARELPGGMRVPFELAALGDVMLRAGDGGGALRAYEELLQLPGVPERAALRHHARVRLAALRDLPPPCDAPPAPVAGNGLLVDVGGHRLYARCWSAPESVAGATVVFDSGLGDGWGQWRHVAPAVGAFAPAVAYSRAGLFPSEPGPLPRTCRRIASDLHTLLAHLGCSPPYVLVGHSVGSRNQRMFATLYPSEVATLLLLDGHDEQAPEDRERENAGLSEEERRR